MKIKDMLLKMNITMICLIALCARIVVVGADIGDALALASIAGLYGYLKYLNKENQTWMKDVVTEIKRIRDEFASWKLGHGMRKVHEKPQEKTQRNW